MKKVVRITVQGAWFEGTGSTIRIALMRAVEKAARMGFTLKTGEMATMKIERMPDVTGMVATYQRQTEQRIGRSFSSETAQKHHEAMLRSGQPIQKEG